MKSTDVIINTVLFLVLSAPPLLAEYLTAEPGNVPGRGFDVLCYEPFDYAYILMALVVFASANILMAHKKKKPKRQAAFCGAGIAIGGKPEGQVLFLDSFLQVMWMMGRG